MLSFKTNALLHYKKTKQKHNKEKEKKFQLNKSKQKSHGSHSQHCEEKSGKEKIENYQTLRLRELLR